MGTKTELVTALEGQPIPCGSCIRAGNMPQP